MTKSFKQFIAEAKQFTFKELLHGDCANFFKQSQQEGLLVRGMNGYGQLVGQMSLGEDFNNMEFTVFRKSVRKDRKPMDTKGPLHKIIDDWFEENTGMRARSEAVFCFGEAARNIAYEYGNLCVIFPIGKFTYTWSPDVPDLYNDVILNKMQHDGRDGAEITKAYVGADGKPDVEAINSALDDLGYTINGFSKAVADSVEIMIDCDEYYIIPLPNDEETREKYLGIIKKAFVKA